MGAYEELEVLYQNQNKESINYNSRRMSGVRLTLSYMWSPIQVNFKEIIYKKIELLLGAGWALGVYCVCEGEGK